MSEKAIVIDAFNFPVGRVLAGKYRVEAFLGSGYEGEVYGVVELATGIERALKIFYPHRNEKDRALRFYAQKLNRLRECSILTQYHHTETIRVRNTRITGLVSELVAGEMLYGFVQRHPGRRLLPFEALHVLHALAVGVEQIHARKDYHGDIHDENILIERRGIGFKVKLVDFYHLGRSDRSKMQEDVIQMARVLYDAVGGQRHYRSQPAAIKSICCGLRRDLISKKFPDARRLRQHLETFAWE